MKSIKIKEKVKTVKHEWKKDEKKIMGSCNITDKIKPLIRGKKIEGEPWLYLRRYSSIFTCIILR